ncbi:MAG: bacteriohemerythrin [Chromatiales bacterium]|jgi:hemerythrin-like metal-binding protein
MTLIEWKDEFRTGIPDVDFEHRQLVDLINDLYAAMQRKEGPPRVVEFLGQIFARISSHFALEEKIMREHSYDEYEDHKAEHERLLDDLRDIMDDYEESGFFSDEEFARRVEDWFVRHFKTRDARLHRRIG